MAPIARTFSSMSRWLFLFLLAIISIASHGSAAATGVVQGVIADDVGGPLPKARVSVGHVSGSIVRSTQSGGMGFYLIADLPAGTYELSASHPGFVTVSTRVSVVSGKATTVSIQLRDRTSTAIIPRVQASAGAAPSQPVARHSD